MLSRKTFPNLAFVLSVLVSLGVCPDVRADNTKNVLTISVDEAQYLRNTQNIVIVDVRTARSWWRNNTKIPGAVRGDPAKVKEWEPKYAHDKTLILYCS